jgi:putative ABC transport system permease protein
MNWIRVLLARRQHERDLSDEIAQHLDEKVEALMAAGVSRREAELAARRAFGSVALTSERGRAVWRWTLVEDFWADARYAARQLRRTPSFAAAAILTLALGLGANTTIFSVMHAIVLQPLPFPEPERLMAVQLLDIRGGPHPAAFAYYTFFEFRRAQVFERMTSYRDTGLTLTGRDVPVALSGQIVSAEFFDVLGVTPVLGRGFVAAEEQAGTRVVVLSHEVWTTHFNADPSILDRPVSLGGQPFTVVGIAPAGFNFPVRPRPLQFWTTLAHDASSPSGAPLTEQRGARTLDVIARLRPGMSIDEAHARMDALAAGLAKREPDTNRNQPATYVRPELHRMLGEMRQPMLLLWGAVGLVLLMACANLANMLLARTADRERELGVRLAIGGSRARVVRQLLTENLLLALLGGAAGVLVAMGAVRALVPLVAENIPRAAGVSIDATVLAFTVGLAMVTSVLVSIPAALWVRRIDVNPGRPSTSRGGTDVHEGVRSVLVVAQVSAGLVLLSGASLLAASFLYLTTRDPGFRPEGLLAFNVSLPGARYKTEGQVRFIEQLLERLRATPGVTAAAAATPLPFEGHEMTVAFNLVDRPSPPSERPRSDMAIVTPGYFAAIGTPVIAGRDFSEQDDDSHPRVIVVNQAFADRFFPGERVIGRRIEPGASSPADARYGGSTLREIVGVVGNARQDTLGRSPDPIYYFPYKQLVWGLPALVVRTSLTGTAIETDLRTAVASLDSEAPVHTVRTLSRMMASGVAVPRLLTLLMGSFSAIALLLTATGLYGLLAYAVMRRTREIGVRLALGATRGRVVGMVLTRALVLVAIGVPLGALGALAVQALLRAVIFTPTSGGPGLLIAATAVVVLTATAAACAPALRAASIDPVRALRSE